MHRAVILVVALWATAAFGAPDLSLSIVGSVSDAQGNSIPYRLFRPPGYDNTSKKFPLVLFLHGAGERGTNNTSQVNSHIEGLIAATQTAQYASYVLAPQVPAAPAQWVNVPWVNGSYTNATAPAASTSMNLTIKLLDQLLASTNIDTSRVYVTGLSMGGFGTWDIMSRRPELFAAGVPMSGGGNVDTASTIKTIPIWAFHGGVDTVVPPSGSRDMIAALQAAGGSPRYTELAGQGHGIWAPIYTDTTTSGQFYPWLYSQSTPEPAGGLTMIGLCVGLLMRRRT